MGNRPLGDLAESVAEQLATESFAPLTEEILTEEDAVESQRASIFSKIRFSWRPEDRAILDRIRLASDSMVEEAFGEAIATIDRFYEQLRIPETTWVDNHEVVRRGPDGRVVWKRSEEGKIIERWDQLTGPDIEMTIADLLRLKMLIAPQVNQLLNEAIYAKHVASDAYDDAWGTVIQGTQGDRTAKANRQSRQDRYHAHFRYVLYSTANTLVREIVVFINRLADIREWQIRSQPR